MGQRLRTVGRGSPNNLWPAQCFLNLLNIKNSSQVGHAPFSESTHNCSQFWLAIRITWAAPRPIKSQSGGVELPWQSPQVITTCCQVENHSSIILTLSHFTQWLYLLGRKDLRLFFFFLSFSWACDSNSSPATFYVNMGLFSYILEIRMTYFIGILWG